MEQILRQGMAAQELHRQSLAHLSRMRVAVAVEQKRGIQLVQVAQVVAAQVVVNSQQEQQERRTQVAVVEVLATALQQAPTADRVLLSLDS